MKEEKFSMSKSIYGFFNDESKDTGFGDSIGIFIVAFIAGVIIYCCTVWGDNHASIPSPYWQIMTVAVPILTFIMIEWIYIDDCKYDLTLKVWRDYMWAKLLAIATGIFVTIIGVMAISVIGAILVGLGLVGISFVNWCGLNTRSLYIILFVIVSIILYFAINILLGQVIKKKKGKSK